MIQTESRMISSIDSTVRYACTVLSEVRRISVRYCPVRQYAARTTSGEMNVPNQSVIFKDQLDRM